MADLIQHRRDTAANWASSNPTLASGELGFVTDVNPVKMKCGDGLTRWNSLAYFAGLVGDTGLAGNTVLNGSGIPPNSLGVNGDFYIDTTGHIIYGAKTGGTWGLGLSLIGAKGETGDIGATGLTGSAATIEVGTVTTGLPGSSVIIENVGTDTDAVLNITIPQGATGASGSGTGDMLKATYDTNGNGKVDQVDDGVATDTAIGNRTADPTTATAYSLTSSLTQWLSWITKRSEEITGYAWGTVLPCSLKSLWEQADIGTLFIPAGILYSPITYAGRNKTYNKIYVNCHGETPTSLVVTLYHNGSLIYTSSAITVNETIATVSLEITGEQTVQAFVSNTTGLTKGVSISLKQVSRA